MKDPQLVVKRTTRRWSTPCLNKRLPDIGIGVAYCDPVAPSDLEAKNQCRHPMRVKACGGAAQATLSCA